MPSYKDLVQIVEALAEADTYTQQSFASAKTALQTKSYDYLEKEFDCYFCNTRDAAHRARKHLKAALELLDSTADMVSYGEPYRHQEFCEAFLTAPTDDGDTAKHVMGNFQFPADESPRSLRYLQKTSSPTAIAVMTWSDDKPHVWVTTYSPNAEVEDIRQCLKSTAQARGIKVFESTTGA